MSASETGGGTLDVELRHGLGAFELDVAFQGPIPGVTALFGRSGAGKSSIVNAIAGLLRPRSGRVRVGGTVFLDRAAGIEMPVPQRRVGYVFQDARLFPHLSVRGNLLYGWRRVRTPDRPIQPGPVIELLGIGHLLDRRPHTLSGGERQRVALGRALLVQPRLLLMDEPLAALDVERKAEILPYLERLKAELRLPIVYVSHAVEEVARLADHVVALAGGRVTGQGPVADLLPGLDPEDGDSAEHTSALLEATVLSHDDAYGLTAVSIPGGMLVLPRVAADRGAALRLRVRAQDVAVAVEPPRGLSIQNAVEARVDALRPAGPAFVTAILSTTGGARIPARITRLSADRLGLAPGRTVWALVKSAALASRV